MKRFLAALAVLGPLLGSACDGAEPAASPTPETTRSATVAASPTSGPDASVHGSRLVLNDDGSATLALTLRTESTGWRFGAVNVAEQDDDHQVVDFSTVEKLSLGTTRVGAADDPIFVRVTGDLEVGDVVTLAFNVWKDDEALTDVDLPLKVRVDERTPADDTVAQRSALADVRVEDARITVVPGQKKAFIGGDVVSNAADSTWTRATAHRSDDSTIDFLHQTATGGPNGFAARKGRLPFGGAWIESENEGGDADYFLAKDLTVGEKITLALPFRSGTVDAVFTVVRG